MNEGAGAVSDDFDLLIAEVDEAEDKHTLLVPQAAYISASDGEESEEEDLLSVLACQAEETPAVTERPNTSSSGIQVLTGKPSAASSALYNAAEGKSQQPNFLADGVEKYSGLLITKTLFPLVVLRERFAVLLFLKLSQLQSRLGPQSPEGPWATVGVLVEKSKPRESKGGRMFSVWKLSDLDGAATTVFLFGEAHQSYFKEPVGSVFALFNGRARSEAAKFDISVEGPEQLVRLGTSKQFGFCKARRKDGQQCSNAVNKLNCAYCEYHVQSELKKMSSGRAQLRSNMLKSTFRNAKAGPVGSTAASSRQYVPLVSQTREQLLSAVQSLPNKGASSLGARYIMKVADGTLDKPGTSKQLDNDRNVVSGAAAYNPNNRPTAQAGRGSAGIPPAPLGLQEEAKKAIKAAPALQRKSQGDGRTRKAAEILISRQSSGGSAKNNLSTSAPELRAAATAAAKQQVDQASSRQPWPANDRTGGKRPSKNTHDERLAATQMPGRGSTGQTNRLVHNSATQKGRSVCLPSTSIAAACDLQQQKVHTKAGKQRESVRAKAANICAASSSILWDCLGADVSKVSEDGAMVTLEDDELEIEPDGSPVAEGQHAQGSAVLERADSGMTGLQNPPEGSRGSNGSRLLEHDYDWTAAPHGAERPAAAADGKLSGQRSGQPVKRPGTVKPPQPDPKRQAVSTVHRDCVFDEEAGGMVEVEDPDSDWQNGRAPMPHQQHKAPGRRTIGMQSIQQRPSSIALREAKAMQQSIADAEARIRAANILKLKAKAKSTPPMTASGNVTQQGLRSPLSQVPSGLRNSTSGAAAEGPSAFYSSSATAKATRTARQYGQMLQKGIQRSTNTITDFTEAFGSVLDNAPSEHAGSRYATLVEEEEEDRLNRLMTSMQHRDECRQKAESVTKLVVSAFQCGNCKSLTERKRSECSGHDVKRVTTTKRWWLCTGCGDHSSTLGVRLRKTRCRRCPSTNFTAATMCRPMKVSGGASAAVASRDQMVATVEQAIAQSSVI